MARNPNASRPVVGIQTSVKCANCGEVGSVFESDDPTYPWVCHACDHWGPTATTTDNPPPDDDWNPTGQVPRRGPEE